MASRVSSGRVMRNFTPTTAFSFDCAILRSARRDHHEQAPVLADEEQRLGDLLDRAADLRRRERRGGRAVGLELEGLQAVCVEHRFHSVGDHGHGV